ncbi:MAG: dienelactone hydrolase family protein, partial [Pirellulaceae bacterium]
ATTRSAALLATAPTHDVFAVRWPALGDVHGEGLLLVPRSGERVADVVAIPDADQLPEVIAGLVADVPVEQQFARRLAESGCRVLVPTLISRQRARRMPPGRQSGANLTNREYIYRAAFELGRHLIGYEVQKILAGVDWFDREAGEQAKIGVLGYGEGGMLAMYAAALDERIDACGVAGHFGPRERIWEQPIDRNVFGLLDQFGDAEVASLIVPRGLLIDSVAGPRLSLPGDGGAPAELTWHEPVQIQREFDRLQTMIAETPDAASALRRIAFSPSADSPPLGDTRMMLAFLGLVTGGNPLGGTAVSPGPAAKIVRELPNADARQARQMYELDRHNQQLLKESEYVRAEFMKKLDTSSPDAYARTVEPYRDIFRNEVVGAFDQQLLPPQPRVRKTYDEARWTGYEVVLDVWPDVIAYGVLLMPKNIPAGEKRPVVVCQHGLEGRPTDVFLGDHRAYHDFAAKLAEEGFITFAPQNLYIFQDRFRTLQRKANPLGKTLFSVIVPQHQQIVNWLKSLPNVDPARIAFYGLSYGGKSAMRIPPLVTDYCLSICSADFNEWVAKNASTRLPFSYMWTGEYEIFEFDLGNTFNYAEMAALICPRPFMVERGHTDGVSTDEWVSYEFAKVRYLYSHRLKIPDRVEMEVFDGPHTINGQGTFAFLRKHLRWPPQAAGKNDTTGQ